MRIQWQSPRGGVHQGYRPSKPMAPVRFASPSTGVLGSVSIYQKENNQVPPTLVQGLQGGGIAFLLPKPNQPANNTGLYPYGTFVAMKPDNKGLEVHRPGQIIQWHPSNSTQGQLSAILDQHHAVLLPSQFVKADHLARQQKN